MHATFMSQDESQMEAVREIRVHCCARQQLRRLPSLGLQALLPDPTQAFDLQAGCSQALRLLSTRPGQHALPGMALYQLVIQGQCSSCIQQASRRSKEGCARWGYLPSMEANNLEHYCLVRQST